jgi:CRISPR-associated exonuclease Cas4
MSIKEYEMLLSPPSLRFTGTQVNYYLICQRKLWLFSHDLQMEQTSDAVFLGRLLHEASFSREKKEIKIDETISIDFIGSDKVIHEVKKSDSVKEAHRFQLLYYLYYLKQKGVEGLKGRIHYPKLKKVEEVILDEISESALKDILDRIRRVVVLKTPPPKIDQRFCKKCSYYDLCWV